MIDFRQCKVMSFDCYGTLIDWESGILDALRPLLASHGCEVPDADVLSLYGELEPAAEKGKFVPYREVLRRVVKGMGERLGFEPAPAELECLAETLPRWPPFPDTVDALRALKARFRLAVISNVDDDLFASTSARLGVAWDWVVTAEQAGSYKPSLRNFQIASDRFRVPPERTVHVAQSIYHDILPACTLGIPTVWVNRRKVRQGGGAATPAMAGRPDLEVPSLASLVGLVGRGCRRRRGSARGAVAPRVTRR